MGFRLSDADLTAGSKFINMDLRLLEREGMLKSHSASTPLNKGMTKQDNYNDGLPDTAADLAARKHFRQILGCLVWLASKCRKDLCMTVNFYGRMGPYAKQAHVDLIRGQPLRYLNGTRDFGLVYQAGSSFETNGASDADFAGCLVTNRSTIWGFGKKGEFGLIRDGCTLVKQIQTSTGHSETTACAPGARSSGPPAFNSVSLASKRRG